MKAIVLLILVATAFAAKTSAQDQILALLQTGTKANDAIDSVYELLNDLKESNDVAQFTQDAKNQTDEFISEATVSRFTQILSINQKLQSEAVANRAFFESELQQAKVYIAWNQARTVEIARKTETLQDNQCYSNQLFVRSLKMNQEALEAISFLKNDLSSYVAAGVENLDLAQIKVKSVAEKLKQYSSIFNNNEINAFLQLADTDASDSDAEVEDDADVASDAEDNGSESSAAHEGKRRGTLPQQLLQVLSDLEASVENSIENLKVNEIEAAWQLAGWISSSEAESRLLAEEVVRKQLYADRSQTQIAAAIAQQVKVTAILGESQDALAQAITDIENKREAYGVEKSKRDEENVILGEITTMFKGQVASWSGRF